MSIPKKVHQIWIGPKKRPDIWMDSVRKFCSEKGYEYILWDDQKVSEMNMINQNKMVLNALWQHDFIYNFSINI